MFLFLPVKMIDVKTSRNISMYEGNIYITQNKYFSVFFNPVEILMWSYLTWYSICSDRSKMPCNDINMNDKLWIQT